MMTFATIEEAWGTTAKESFTNKPSMDTLKRFSHPSVMQRSVLASAAAGDCPQQQQQQQQTPGAEEAAASRAMLAAVFEQQGLEGVVRLLPRSCLDQLVQAIRCQSAWLATEDFISYVLIAVIAYVAFDALSQVLLARRA